MGILDGGTHFAISPRALSISFAPRVRQSICEPGKIAATICSDARELSDHTLET